MKAAEGGHGQKSLDLIDLHGEAVSYQPSAFQFGPPIADNILLSETWPLIDISYQSDSNIPFDGMAENAQNQPPWSDGTEPFPAGQMNLPSVQDCCSREETSFPADLGFQERTRYGYNSR